MKYCFWVGILGAGLCFSSCIANKKEYRENKSDSVAQETTKVFRLPEVPVMIMGTEEETVFLANHYWEHFDFNDTTCLRLPDVTEQAIVGYMQLLQNISSEDALNALKRLSGKVAEKPRLMQYCLEIFSKYWYDPNSPMKDEEMFILLCKSVEQTDNVSAYLKRHARYLRGLIEKNRVGTRAADIVYTLNSDEQGCLYDLTSPYTLVFFYNPDCHTCAEIRESMCESSLLRRLQANKQLKVLAIYPDEDVSLWRKHLSEMPEQWINSYDKGMLLSKNEVYDLSSIPSFYLLDKDKFVLLKDADWMEVIHFLEVEYGLQ